MDLAGKLSQVSRSRMPILLAGKKFTGKFLFEGQDKILKQELKLI